ncbi:MAG: DNA mismatch repair endonuclease MutL [Elainella sp. Prado103]|jgi:DNA mismatch repair protein MutL|nr:DNA mismatch repair endonuclease MutL [Elainella sp. Prado103]
MDGLIRALPIDVVHLMVAGEVIDSLAAVVRELAENAIDAGATRIHIGVWVDQWRVRVTDNGQGMSLEDLRRAALPHATSKIQQQQDLWRIGSLGFRGEALHSLAQLAELEICSRQDGEDGGYRLVYQQDGEPERLEPLAMAVGTIVTANGLFGNWLSRRQGLAAAQLRSVQQVIAHLALCHPQITWRVEQNDRPWFGIWGEMRAQQVLPQLLREVQVADLHQVDLNATQEWGAEAGSRLSLLIGLPDRCHRRRSDWVKVAVNGRVVALPELEQTLIQGLRRAVPGDRYPVCFLHLQVDPAQVDWNRHPAKAEIFLRHLTDWQRWIQQAIDRALQSSLVALPDEEQLKQLTQQVKAAEREGVYRTSRAIEMPAMGDAAVGDGGDPRSESLVPLKAVAQVHQMYILVEHPAGLWLVEQHIAHERVLYEELIDRWQVVPLESPLRLGALRESQVEQLQRLGIEVEPFGEQQWVARSVPEKLADRSDCGAALLELSQGGDLESALVATACRTAIRNGTPLTLPEMQQLIDRWQHSRNPRTCPHGRPIYLPLMESSLSRFFRRHWVVGKSHGI